MMPLDSFIALKFGICIFIETRSECVDDSGCPGHQECIHDKCKNICRTTTCGRNAECEANNHNVDCKCVSGFVGDPYKVCEKGQTIFIWLRFLSNYIPIQILFISLTYLFSPLS